MKKNILIVVYTIFSGLCLLSCDNNATPKNGNENTEKQNVLKIGEAIAFKEYGDVIKKQLPLKAKLVRDSVWVIEGTLSKGSDGGTVYIELSKGDNRLLKITHFK